MYRWYRPERRVIPARILTVAFSLAFLLSLFAATPALAAPSTASANAAPQAKVSKPVVKSALKHDKSPALKSMKPKVPKQGNHKAKDLPVLPVPHNNVKGPTSNAKSGSADVQKSVVTNNMPTPQQNFEGVGNLNGVLPPDTQGDVGPNN